MFITALESGVDIKRLNDYGADSIAGGGASLSGKFSWLNMLEELRWDFWAESRESSVSRDIYRDKGYVFNSNDYCVNYEFEIFSCIPLNCSYQINLFKMKKIIGLYPKHACISLKNITQKKNFIYPWNLETVIK